MFWVVIVLEYKIVPIEASGRGLHVVNNNALFSLFPSHGKRNNAIPRKASLCHRGGKFSFGERQTC